MILCQERRPNLLDHAVFSYFLPPIDIYVYSVVYLNMFMFGCFQLQRECRHMKLGRYPREGRKLCMSPCIYSILHIAQYDIYRLSVNQYIVVSPRK